MKCRCILRSGRDHILLYFVDQNVPNITTTNFDESCQIEGFFE